MCFGIYPAKSKKIKMKKELLTGIENKNGLYGYLPGNDPEAGNNFKFTIMKKIFTLVFVSLFALAVKADDHRPSVSVINNTNFKVVIDGRAIYSDYDGSTGIYNMGYGRHTITVIDERGSFFDKRDRVISSSSFAIDGNDRMVYINVGKYGYINIDKAEFGRDDHGYDDRKGFDNDKGRSKMYDWNNKNDNHKSNDDHGKMNDRPGKHF
jgi:hypothetical protein